MKLCFIDLETTGLDPCKHGIVQLSGIIRVPEKPDVPFNICMKPFEKDEIDLAAMGINNVNYKDGLEPRAAHRELVSILGRFVDKYDKLDKFFFVGFNAQFDYQFLRKFFEKCGDKYFGSWFWFPYIDVMQLALQKLLVKRSAMVNFKLATVANTLGVLFDDGNAHNAAYDIARTAALYDKVSQ